jgi:hypothetical protein
MTIPYPNVPGVTFKMVPDYPGYCVGDDGSIWSSVRVGGRSTYGDPWRRLAGRRKPRKTGGHIVVHRRDRSGRSIFLPVHRLVLEAFVGPCPIGMECCHNDGDPTNNRLENLRWDTHRANGRDASLHGVLTGKCRGESHGQSKLSEGDVAEIRRLRATGMSYPAIARRFPAERTAVRHAAIGLTWRHCT